MCGLIVFKMFLCVYIWRFKMRVGVCDWLGELESRNREAPTDLNKHVFSCSVLLCVVVCCSVLWRVAWINRISASPHLRAATLCNTLQQSATYETCRGTHLLQRTETFCSTWQSVAKRCKPHCNTHCNKHCHPTCRVRRSGINMVLQCVAACCSVLQCVAVWQVSTEYLTLHSKP